MKLEANQISKLYFVKYVIRDNIHSKRGINMMIKENIDQDLPEEWVELVREAMKSNINKGEFKKFLKGKTKLNKD